MFRNASKLMRKLSKTKDNPKAGILLKHLENAVGSEALNRRCSSFFGADSNNLIISAVTKNFPVAIFLIYEPSKTYDFFHLPSLGRNSPLCSKLYSDLRSIRSNCVKERDTTENIERRLVTGTSFLRHGFASRLLAVLARPLMDSPSSFVIEGPP